MKTFSSEALTGFAYEAVMAYGTGITSGEVRILPIHDPEQEEVWAGRISGLITAAHHLADVVAPDIDFADILYLATTAYDNRKFQERKNAPCKD